MKSGSRQARVKEMSAQQQGARAAACANKCHVVVHDTNHAGRARRAKDREVAQEAAGPPVPPLPVFRPFGTMLRSPPQEWPLRRLGLVSAGWKAATALVRQTARPPHPQATL